jgi:hypothetical protein
VSADFGLIVSLQTVYALELHLAGKNICSRYDTITFSLERRPKSGCCQEPVTTQEPENVNLSVWSHIAGQVYEKSYHVVVVSGGRSQQGRGLFCDIFRTTA